MAEKVEVEAGRVVGRSLVTNLKIRQQKFLIDLFYGAVAQLGERRFCKPEVIGSIPISSTFKDRRSEQ